MFVITFTPALHDSTNDAVVSLPMRSLGENMRVDSPSLAQCLTLFNQACGRAAHFTPDEVNANFPESHKKPHNSPIVHVCGFWQGRDRKPSGFNQRRWQRYVVPTGQAEPTTQAAE